MKICKKIPTVGNSFHCKGRNLYTEIVNFSQAFLPSGGKKMLLIMLFISVILELEVYRDQPFSSGK